ncbi:MAG TPA: hypothetical protein VD814_10910 [Nocardioides sp.]|nr:hypothetical protein [Nocardioides sp.]
MTSSETTHDPQTASPRRWLLLGLLVALLLAATAADVWLMTTRGAEVVGVEGDAAETQAEREAVMSQTRQFLLRVGTFGPDELEEGRLSEHRANVSEVITPSFRTSFERQVVAAEQLVAQAGVTRSAQVFSTGVTTIDSDSATALVAGAFVDSYEGRRGGLQPQEPVPLRWEVSLVKTGGEWLVDDFAPVTGEEAP